MESGTLVIQAEHNYTKNQTELNQNIDSFGFPFRFWFSFLASVASVLSFGFGVQQNRAPKQTELQRAHNSIISLPGVAS